MWMRCKTIKALHTDNVNFAGTPSLSLGYFAYRSVKIALHESTCQATHPSLAPSGEFWDRNLETWLDACDGIVDVK